MEDAGRTHRNDARQSDARAVRHALRIAAGRLHQRLEHVGRRGDFGKFLRVGRTDIDQRLQRAVGGLPQAEFAGREWSRSICRDRRRSASVRASRRRAMSPSPARRCRPWSGAAPRDPCHGPAAAALPRRGQAASSASARFAAADRDAGRRLHSRAPTARSGRTAAARRVPRHSATAATAACRRRRSSPAAWSRCGYRRCGRSGSNAAARMPSPRARASPDGVYRRRSDAHRTASRSRRRARRAAPKSSGVRQMLVVEA